MLDILLADCGFYLADIPFKVITDFEIPDDILGDSVVMRQVRLQFQKLNANLEAKLNDFILNHLSNILITLQGGKMSIRKQYLLDKKIWENERDADKSIPTPYGDSENSVIVI